MQVTSEEIDKIGSDKSENTHTTNLLDKENPEKLSNIKDIYLKIKNVDSFLFRELKLFFSKSINIWEHLL